MMFGVDGFSAFALRYGTQAAETIGRVWAGLLIATAPQGMILGDLGDGLFGAVLPNCGEEAATAW